MRLMPLRFEGIWESLPFSLHATMLPGSANGNGGDLISLTLISFGCKPKGQNFISIYTTQFSK